SGLPCLDMLGLCDGTIAKTPPPRPDHVIPAHSRGNPKYVLDREPDLLLFGTPTGELWPRWPGGWQMEAEEPRFLTDYRCIVAHTGPVPVVGEGETDLAITFRVRVDGRVGVARAGDRITVPGWLLTGHRQPVAVHRHEVHLLPKDPARLGPIVEAALAMQHWWENEAAVAVLDRAAGQLVGEVRKPGPLALEDIALPAGSYRLTTEPPVATTGIAFELRGRNGTICERDGELFRLPAEGRVDVVGAVGAAVALPLQLRTLRLERTDAR
ncbi:MAG: hypothetical protein KDE27_18955, partial [Planctomycetes bacterium]|nr:hypothetical protein [Planctomycetota bacterium]